MIYKTDFKPLDFALRDILENKPKAPFHRNISLLKTAIE